MSAMTLAEKADWYYQEYPIEIGLLVLFAIALLNYALGWNVNRSRAQTWLKTVEPVIKENFKLIGTDTLDEHENIEFEDNSAHEFPLLLGKRKNLEYANLNLIFEKR